MRTLGNRNPERFAPRLGVDVKIGLLPDTDYAISLPVCVVVVRRSVESAPVVPDRHIILLPVIAYLIK